MNKACWKRIRKLFLVILTLALLTACGGGGNTADSAASTPDMQEASADSAVVEQDAAESTVSSEDGAAAEASEGTEGDSQAETVETAETETPDEADDVWDLSYIGMIVPMPDAYLANRDKVYIYPSAEMIPGEDGTRIAIVRFLLYPASEEALMSMGETEYDAITPGIDIPYTLAGMPDGKGADVLNTVLSEYGLNWDASFSDPLGSAGNYTYYECIVPSWESSTVDPGEELLLVYEDVKEGLKESIQNAVFTDTIGSTAFTTTDLDGNPVDSTELFAQSKVTMVNLWTTWCTYCIREMPEIQEIYEEYSARGCNVVGILMDADEPGALEEAADLIAQTGVLYQNLRPTKEIESALPPEAYPTTYFIDGNGKLLGDPVVGADIEAYRARLDEYLG